MFRQRRGTKEAEERERKETRRRRRDEWGERCGAQRWGVNND